MRMTTLYAVSLVLFVQAITRNGVHAIYEAHSCLSALGWVVGRSPDQGKHDQPNEYMRAVKKEHEQSSTDCRSGVTIRLLSVNVALGA